MIPGQPVKAGLGSARARLAVHANLSAPRDQRARDASGRRVQSTCQRRKPVVPRGIRIRERGGPRPHRRMVPARGDHPLRPALRRPRGRCVPAGACHGARSSDTSVTDRASQSSRASSTRPAKTASTATQRDERRLSRPEASSIDRGALLGPFPGTPSLCDGTPIALSTGDRFTIAVSPAVVFAT